MLMLVYLMLLFLNAFICSKIVRRQAKTHMSGETHMRHIFRKSCLVRRLKLNICAIDYNTYALHFGRVLDTSSQDTCLTGDDQKLTSQ